ncbi:MAG: formylglycine-generating enzyme family protein [Thermoguttaceae bacterium]
MIGFNRRTTTALSASFLSLALLIACTRVIYAEPAAEEEAASPTFGAAPVVAEQERVSHEKGNVTESKAAGDTTKSPPKELTVDLGKGVKLELVLIPAGEFLMGSPEEMIKEELKAHGDEDYQGHLREEEPQHYVRITKPFYLGKYLVTKQQWQAIMGNTPSQGKGPRNPVENVSWNDCQKFVEKLNAKLGKGVEEHLLPAEAKFKLPTEAHWEYACRAGSTTRYHFGDRADKLGEYAWYRSNSGGKTHPVGLKKPNAWGLYDMYGNIYEWCADWCGAYDASSPADDPTGPATGSYRVNRGGGYFRVAERCRSAYRGSTTPEHGNGVGLRVCLGPTGK